MMILVVSVDSRSDDDVECLSKMIEYHKDQKRKVTFTKTLSSFYEHSFMY